MTKRLYDGDNFAHRGRSFKVRFPFDDSMRAPWEEHDGHGVVSDWTTREKKPGERILSTDRSSHRFYDVTATLVVAKKDGWGCGDQTHTHKTAKEKIACAVEKDFQYLSDWCNDRWHWCGVEVVLLDAKGHKTPLNESIWGIEDSADEYLSETAYELADQLADRADEIDAHELVCVACKGTGIIRV